MITEERQQAIRDRIRDIPIMRTLDFNIERLEEGRCIGSIAYDRNKFAGIYESFHGGLLMTIADTLACFAVMTITGPDEMMATTDMNIRFLAPCTTDVRADARIIKVGRSLCPTTIDLYDMNDKLVAIAQVTYMRLPGIPTRASSQ